MQTLNTVLNGRGANDANGTDLAWFIVMGTATSLCIVVCDLQNANGVSFWCTALIEVKAVNQMSASLRLSSVFSVVRTVLSTSLLAMQVFNRIQFISCKR